MTVEDLLWEALEEAMCCGTVHSSDMSVSLFAETMRKEVLDEVYEALRHELVERNDEVDRDRGVLVNPYHTHEHRDKWTESRGRARGVCRAMEIVEAMKERA